MAPPKIPDTIAHYDVRHGDSLWSIAIHQLGYGPLADDLAKLNGLKPNAKLKMGQRLIVPDYSRDKLTVGYMRSEMVNNRVVPDANAWY